MWEGVGDRTELQHIDPPLLWPSAFLSRSPGLLNRRPSLSRCWFSLPHLVSNLSGLQNSIGGPEGPFCRMLFFSTASSLQTDWISYAISYIIVERPPSCGHHNRTHSTRPRSRLYSDIPWVDAPVIYIGAFPILTVWLGRRSIYNTNINLKINLKIKVLISF